MFHGSQERGRGLGSRGTPSLRKREANAAGEGVPRAKALACRAVTDQERTEGVRRTRGAV
jgi:hypothetical protein